MGQEVPSFPGLSPIARVPMNAKEHEEFIKKMIADMKKKMRSK